MKWLTDLFRTDPDKMTPFGRQVLAAMNIHPEDWGLGLDVAHHPEFGTFERTVFTGFQRARPTLSTRDSIAAESVRKDFRQLNRHDRRAFGQRHATMLASEIPPKAAPENLTAQGAVFPQTPGPIAPQLTATEMQARRQASQAQHQKELMEQMTKMLNVAEREIQVALQLGDVNKAERLRQMLHQQMSLAANPAVIISPQQVAAEFGITPNNLNKLSTL